ncbi:hypothetical protein Ancab_003215 [Ancistrocladus abbreviatus]
MAIGKMRTNKRPSSSSSYASTMTTIVFIGLCVLGVWMLTSGDVVNPQSTTRTSSTESTALNPDEKITIPTKSNDKGAFEDNPGDLPDDALKSDDQSSRQQQEPDQKPDSNNNEVSKESNAATTSTEASNQAEEKTDRQESTAGGGGDNEGGKESVGEQEKQNDRENQVSEESSATQNQNIQQSTADSNAQNDSANQVEESKTGDKNGNTEDSNNENQPGKQQQQQQQQQQEDESQQQQGKQQRQDQKQVTFTDETKQEQSAKPVDEEVITKGSTQQSKEGNQESKTKPDEQEEGKQDSQKDNSSNETTKQDVATNANTEDNPGEANPGVSLPNSGIPKESKESKKSWSTQAANSNKEKQRRKDKLSGKEEEESIYGYTWQLCNVTAGPDYIPCLDNEKAVKKLSTTKHFEHRERHCPEDPPTCLVPLPQGYKKPISWPSSRDKIWFHNVPHTQLAEVKGHQNWVKVTGEFLTFPGGGTQFIHGALHYIDFINQSVPGIGWGRHTRVVLDVGCGVASFGGYLFDRDVLTMSFAPKDEHEAQVQFALERGIPAISAVMGTQRLPFPSGVFDLVHCARCRVPWHEEGGRLLLELNRVLRPGGHFVWSATPVYQKLPEDVEIWEAMSSLTASMCWKLETIQNDKTNKIGAAIYRKPNNNQCYQQRKQDNPPLCKDDDDPNAAWYVPLQPCMHRVPVDQSQRGSRWPVKWSKRLRIPPYWLNQSQMGIYGKPAPDDFLRDYEHWKRVVNNSYLTGLGISWSDVRNVMDMRAVYGGFAAALRDHKIWVLNVVNVNSPDTLPIIFERGLFGIYHDWCEGFSTYPRTYDLLHADHLFSKLKERCKLPPVMAEIDRMVRPGGKLIVRDESGAIGEVENLLKSLHWEVHLTFSKDQEGILSAQKSSWRPKTFASS